MQTPEGDDAAPGWRQDRRDAERRRLVQRRRRTALAVASGLAALLGAFLGARGGEEGENADGHGAPRSGSAACDPRIAARPAALAGRMLIVRMEAEATPELLARARRGELGGVIVFPPPAAPMADLAREIAKLTRAGVAGNSPPLLVAIDQEGGPVKRLPALPPERSPAELADAGIEAPALALREGEATGRALRKLGINLDLAPVLDVPSTPGAFIAERAFGKQSAEVAVRGLAFARGLESAGVGATAKHFPGLGLAEANTDLGPSAIDATQGELAPGLAAFREASEAGIAAIMVANASYPALGARVPASISPVVIEDLLREELAFDGVIVTDDLGAGAITGAGIEEGEAAVRSARAGADLLLFALSDGELAHRALVRAIRRGQLDLEQLRASCARSSALAERLAATG